jgi:hypothetical protein
MGRSGSMGTKRSKPLVEAALPPCSILISTVDPGRLISAGKHMTAVKRIYLVSRDGSQRVSLWDEKIAAKSLIFLPLLPHTEDNSLKFCDLPYKGYESLLNPCLEPKFEDFGQN